MGISGSQIWRKSISFYSAKFRSEENAMHFSLRNSDFEQMPIDLLSILEMLSKFVRIGYSETQICRKPNAFWIEKFRSGENPTHFGLRNSNLAKKQCILD
ncbi:hypothetical protein DLK05_16500 [Ancylomarina longa]|uniref:Uncharacterized protein n=1 Tax=Ancylomarina longa TaxID=2487017 RepID=A0A434AEM2_9BACT|nr:hypothetical protein DLK05_16500 [Ancylomarina longa]